MLAKNKKPVRRALEAAADSPQAIKRKIDQSFEFAERDLNDVKKLKHPTKKHLQLVEAVPLIPDLDAFPDSGAYVTIKFLTNPVQSGSEYDNRLLSGLFRPIDRTAAEEAVYEEAVLAHEQDPYNNTKPQNLMNYDFYLGHSGATGDSFRRKFDVENPNRDEEALYTHQADTGGCYQFNRLRAYETAQETELDHPTKYQQEIILAYHDDDSFPRQKAVYYYPVMQKSTIRPQRTKNIARTVGVADEGEQIVDQLDVTVADPTEEMREAMLKYRTHPLGWEQDDAEEDVADDGLPNSSAPAPAAPDSDANGADPAGDSPPPIKSPIEEQDAEGEEEEDDEDDD